MQTPYEVNPVGENFMSDACISSHLGALSAADYAEIGNDSGMNLAERIELARRNANLSQARLALQIGTKQATVSRWEAGEFAPSVEQVQRIADATGADAGWLFTGVEPEPVPTLTHDEQSLLQLYHALGLSIDEALRALASTPRGERPPARSTGAIQLPVRVTTEHHERLERERKAAARRAASEAAKQKAAGKKPATGEGAGVS